MRRPLADLLEVLSGRADVEPGESEAACFYLRHSQLLLATDGESYGHHHAHGLHAPFWWLKCAVGVSHSDHPAVTAYHKMLVWDLMRRPRITRVAESVLNPLVGKSVAMYFVKHQAAQVSADAREATRGTA